MPGAAGMIKVDVRQDDVIDSAGIEPQFLQGKASVGEGILAAGIDEGDTPVVNDQWIAAENRPYIPCIKGVNSIAVVAPVEHACPLGKSLIIGAAGVSGEVR